jgi:hypothetical protein
MKEERNMKDKRKEGRGRRKEEHDTKYSARASSVRNSVTS